MTGVRVRPADGNDLDTVVAVGRAAWLAAHGPLFDPEIADLLLAKWWTPEAMIPAIRAGRTVVAEADGETVGMATYGSDEGRRVIWRLYVLPERQGLGAGRALLDAVLDRIRDTHDAAYLPFYDGTTGAYDFARRHGFVEDHRENDNLLPDVVYMRRDLTEGAP